MAVGVGGGGSGGMLVGKFHSPAEPQVNEGVVWRRDYRIKNAD